jgi:apolipoprotein N-acyltransferase
MITRLSALALRRPGLCALLIGAASATGFAPLGLWPVTLVALALLLWLLDHVPTHRAAFGLGWLFGLGHFTVGNNWIANAFTFQAKMPAWIGMAAVPLLALYLALFIGLATWAAWAVWQRVVPPVARHSREGGSPSPDGATSPEQVMDSRLRGNDDRREKLTLALLFAAAWIVTEWLRSWAFTGFAWNPLSAISVLAAAPTRWIGTYGQAGLIILTAAALSQMIARRWIGALLLAALPAVLIPAATFDMIGNGTIAAINAKRPDSRHTPITVVQPNIGQGDKWDMARRLVNFRKLASLSEREANEPPRLLLWPEAAVPDYLESGYPLDWYAEPASFARSRLASLLGPDDLMLTGAVKLDPNEARTDVVSARNSVFVLDAQAQLGPRYDKAHLVPYGEYLPARTILSAIGISRLAPGAVDFHHGPGPRTLDLGRFGTVGIQICYEIIFSGNVVDRADRPAFIFNPSNDAWFGSWGPPQHLAQARLRAIEEGLPVVRATPTGVSAVIDADGRVVESIGMGVAGRIDTLVPVAHAPTLFARYGNILPLGLAALLAFAGVALGRRRR